MSQIGVLPPHPLEAVHTTHEFTVGSHTGAVDGHCALSRQPTQVPLEGLHTGAVGSEVHCEESTQPTQSPPDTEVSQIGARPEQPSSAVQRTHSRVCSSQIGVAPLHDAHSSIPPSWVPASA